MQQKKIQHNSFSDVHFQKSRINENKKKSPGD